MQYVTRVRREVCDRLGGDVERRGARAFFTALVTRLTANAPRDAIGARSGKSKGPNAAPCPTFSLMPHCP